MTTGPILLLALSFLASAAHGAPSFVQQPGTAKVLVGESGAQWIWNTPGTVGSTLQPHNALVTFTKTFQSPKTQIATIYVMANDSRVDVFLNEAYIISYYHADGEPCTTWAQGATNAVTATTCETAVPVLVAAGANTIVLRVANYNLNSFNSSPAAVIVAVKNSFTRALLTCTDATWESNTVTAYDTFGGSAVSQAVVTSRPESGVGFPDTNATYIWATSNNLWTSKTGGAPLGVVYTFSKSVSSPRSMNATLRIAVDDGCDVFVNSVYQGTVRWKKGGNVVAVPVPLRSGTNDLSLRCMNAPQSVGSFLFCCISPRSGNPAYLVATLSGSDGTVLARTDSTWRITYIGGNP